jgi:hypothetical protein
MSHLFVDAIRSIAVINGVVRIEFIRFDRNDAQSDKPVVVPAGQILVPFSRFNEIATRVQQANERLNAAAKPAEGGKPVERRAAPRTGKGNPHIL